MKSTPKRPELRPKTANADVELMELSPISGSTMKSGQTLGKIFDS